MRLTCNYISAALKRAVTVNIVLPSPQYGDTFGTLPPSYEVKDKFPVVYLLHGMGNDCNPWLSYTQAELFAEEHCIALVAVGGENKSYANCGSDKFEELIREELPQMVCSYFPVSNNPKDTYICGLSMGGFGAMLNYLKKPQRYGAVGCFSAAFDRYPDLEKQMGESYNLHKLVAANKKQGAPFAPMYIAIGENDFLLESNFAFKKTLEDNNVPFTWVLDKGFSHEWRFWNKQLELFLQWLPRTDAYAGTFKKL